MVEERTKDMIHEALEGGGALHKKKGIKKNHSGLHDF
jgi:hypothetical protein